MSLPMSAVPLLIAWLLASAAAQEGTTVPFSASKHDATQPVEITADRLELDQSTGVAVFSGGVRAGQGALRIAADRMQVRYRDEGGESAGTIDRIEAEGNVTLSNGSEAAEAAKAIYDVGTGFIELEGDVLLTQGSNVLASNRMRIDLAGGTGVLEGRVQTIFNPGAPR